MDELIERYLQYLQYERNASPHTIRNYRSDLLQFRDYLARERPGTPVDIARVDAVRIRGFLGFLFANEKKKTSIARKLAAVRAFFKFLQREGVLKENPAALISTPKLDRNLPRIMTEEEMNTFLDRVAEAAKVGGPLLQRDDAILELLYASGLRVSELVGSDLRSVNFSDSMVLVRGKGRKERIVPFGSKAKQALLAYLPLREKLLREHRTGSPALFLNARGDAAHLPLRGPAGEELRAHVWSAHQGQPALPASRFRLAPAERRGGLALHPGDAGPQESLHDAEVHPGVDPAVDRCLRQNSPKSLSESVKLRRRRLDTTAGLG